MNQPEALIRLTASARTSTDNRQNPGGSLRWQPFRASALIVSSMSAGGSAP
jgi:hypothetical protein